MKIHCINLKRATERREQILKDWNGYDIEFFDAIDRRDIADVLYFKDLAIKNIGRPLTDGERANCYSHMAIIKKFLDSDDNFFIVIEDDVRPIVPYDEFFKTIDMCKAASTDKEIFLLIKPHPHNSFPIYKSDDSFIWCGENVWGTFGMLYTRDGASRMLSSLAQLTSPSDGCWKDIGKDNLLLMCKNPIIEHIANDSYIEQHPRGHRLNFIP